MENKVNCFPKIILPNGDEIDLNKFENNPEGFEAFKRNNKGFYKFIERQLHSDSYAQKSFVKRNDHSILKAFPSNSIKEENYNERKNSSPVFIHTVDRPYFRTEEEGQEQLEKVQLNNWNLQAPTVKLQQEGMDYINSPKFVVGTPVFYAYAPLHYNRMHGNKDPIKLGRLSAITFADANNDPLPLKFIHEQFRNLQQLVADKKVNIKWVGALYDYNTPYYKNLSETLDSKSNDIRINRFRSEHYKRQVITSKKLLFEGDHGVLQIQPNVYELVHEVIGFNPNFDFQQNEDGTITENRKSVTQLNYIEGKIPKIGVFTGYEEGTNGHPTDLQIPGMNETLSIHDARLANFTNLDKLTGKLVLMVPTNVTNSINSHYPLKIVTKALNYNINPKDDSDASTVILLKLRSLLNKVLRGEIQYELLNKDTARPSFVEGSFIDNTVVKYKDLKLKDEGLRQGVINYFKNTDHYKNYRKDNANPTDYGFEEYIEQINPEIEGIYKYESIIGDNLISFEELIEEILGLEKVKKSGLFTLLANWKAMAEANMDPIQAWEQFLSDWGAAGKPIQILVTQLTNPKYWDRWIKRYGLLKTGLNAKRPTHSVSYYTAPVDPIKINIPNAFSANNESFESDDDISDVRYSSDFGGGTNLTREEVLEWVNRNFPKIKNIEFREGLIDDLYNGSYDRVADLIKYSLEYNTLGVIREEFGHKVFAQLAKSEQDFLLAQARKENPSATTDIELEEYIMAKLRYSPEKVMPKSKMMQFFNNLKEILKTIFRQREAIENFISKFNSGYYKNIKDKNVNSPDFKEAQSLRTQKLSKERLSIYVNLVNKYFMRRLLKGTNLITLLDDTQSLLSTNINGALQFLYKETLRYYIKNEQADILDRVQKTYPQVQENITTKELADFMKLIPINSEEYNDLHSYGYLSVTLQLLQEPLFQEALYLDLKNTYNLKISGVVESPDKDGLGIVKAKDIKIVDQFSPALKFLVSIIPDVAEIKEGQFKANTDKLGLEKTGIASPTEVENIGGVVYGNSLGNELDTNIENRSKFYTYNFKVKNRLSYLSNTLSDCVNPQEMMVKLTELYKFGEDWARVYAFKIMEEYDIMGDKSPLIQDQWRISQLYFVNNFASFNTGPNARTYSLNVISNKNQLKSNFEKSGKMFGFSSYDNLTTLDYKQTLALLKDLQRIHKSLSGLSKTKQNLQLIKGFGLLNIFVSQQDLKSVFGYKDRSALLSIYNNLVAKAFIRDEKGELIINVGLGLGYNDLDEKDNAKSVLNDLASLLAKNKIKSRTTSFQDVDKEQRNSFTKPNMVFAHLARLFRDKDYAKYMRSFEGFSKNPLLIAFQNALKGNKDYFQDFEIAIFNGNKTTATSFEDMDNNERTINALNNAAQGVANKKHPWGFFSLGNFGSSPTNYNVKAPILSKRKVIENFYELIKNEVDILTSGAEAFDKEFAKNKNKGIYYFKVNHIVFKDLEITKENRIAALANIEQNKEAIVKIIEAELEANSLAYYNNLKANNPNLVDYLHSSYLAEEINPEEENILRLNRLIIKGYYYNTSYYQAATNNLFIVHPYYFKNNDAYAKRAKLLHTSGDVNYDNFEDLSSPVMHPYVLLEDKFTSSSDEILSLISEQAFSYNKEEALKDYQNNPGTDSGAYMSMAMLKHRNKEGRGWNHFDEEYYKAQMALDIEKIAKYESKVSWQPIKNGAFSLRPVNTGDYFKPNILIPTIQKYSFQLLLPSEAYVTKGNKLVHPEALLKEFKTIEEVYAQYKSPELAKIVHSQFENGGHFAYYESGAKSGKINPYNPSTEIAPTFSEIPTTDIREITKQPNKNDTKSRGIGIQSRMIGFGMIEDNQIYNIRNYGEMNGDALKELLMSAYSADIQEKLKSTGFLVKNALGGYNVNREELHLYLKEYLIEKDFADEEDLVALELTPDKTKFVLPLSLGNRPGMALNIINAAIDKALTPEVNAPAYKNVTRTSELKSYVVEENGVKGLIKEAKVNMWPELYNYYKRKLKENNVAADNFKGQMEIKSQIIDEINRSGFKMNIYRIPTEYGYSFIRIKILDLGPPSLGNGIELPDDWTTQTGGDLDGDSMFTLMSSLMFGDKISIIEPGIDSKAVRQSLYSEINDKVLAASVPLQLVSSENNVINRVADAVPIKESLKIGTIEANEDAQYNNDLGDVTIGAAAVTNSTIWFLHGIRNKVNISVAKGFPTLDKEYDNDLLAYEVIQDPKDLKEGEKQDLTKMGQSNTGVAAAVNMPSDLTFTKLGFDKKTVSVMTYMTAIMTVPMEYALEFLQSPIIKAYRAEVLKLGAYNKNPKYNQELKVIKNKYLRSYDDYEQLLDQVITKEDLKNSNTEIDRAIIAKFIFLSSTSSDIVKLTLSLGKLMKAGDGSPEKLFSLFEDLKELPKYFPGIQKVLPEVYLDMASGHAIYKMKNPSVVSQLNSNYDVFLAKLGIGRESSYYFHEKFLKYWNYLKGSNKNLKGEDAVYLENFFFRYLVSKGIKPLTSYTHLGTKVTTEEANNKLLMEGRYTFNYIQNKLFNQIGTLEGEPNTQLAKMLFTLGFLKLSEGKITYRDTDKQIKQTHIVQMASSFYEDETLSQFQEGFMTMINHSDKEISTFAKNLRDFTVLTGWEKTNLNFGGFLPRESWLNDVLDYNAIVDRGYNELNSQDPIDGNFLQALVIANPTKFSVQVYGSAKYKEGKKPIYPFTRQRGVKLLTGEQYVGKQKDNFGQNENVIRNHGFFKNQTMNDSFIEEMGWNAAPPYFHMKEGNMIGLYRRAGVTNNYVLFSVNADLGVLDSSVRPALAISLEEIPMAKEERVNSNVVETSNVVEALKVEINNPSIAKEYLDKATNVKWFNWNRPNAARGTDADVAMRKEADGFIGEGVKEDSSTITSSKEIASKLKLPIRQLRRAEPGKPVYLIGYIVNIGEANTTPTKVMLARNGSLEGKELKEDTKAEIRRAKFAGAEFILGNMPGVDTAFMDYLNEIGAKYEIYGNIRNNSDTQLSKETVSNGPQNKIEDIYSKLGDITQSKNVILPKDVDLEANNIGMTYTTAIDFWRNIVPEAMDLYNKARPLIVAFRGNSQKTFLENYKSNTNTIGNPFNWQLEKGTQAEQDQKSLKKFIEWIITGNNFRVDVATKEYRQALITDFKSGKWKKSSILYYEEKGHPTHATALDYLINEYDFNASDQTSLQEPKGKKIAEGVYINQNGLTKKDQLEIFNYLKPFIEEQAAKTNKGKNANYMLGLNLRWDYKNNNPTLTPVPIESIAGNELYGYYQVSINGKPLGQFTNRLRQLIEKATGINVKDYDAAIINIYTPDTFINNHPDKSESKTAINYPVVALNIGGNGNFRIGSNIKENLYELKDGAGYSFGFKGKNRTEFHSTTAADINGFLPEITLKHEGITLKESKYRISITVRRAMALEQKMPVEPLLTSLQKNNLQDRIALAISIAETKLPTYGLTEEEVKDWVEKLKAINSKDEFNNLVSQLAALCK